ncbi:MAG: alpha/beta hydrolase, partial [Pseudomonadota bacterium]
IPDYRLHPDVVFPTFVEDAAKAVSWVIDNGDKYGADTSTLFVMGHSAGAHIAAMLSTDARFLGAHDVSLQQLSGFIGLSGPYDFLPLESGYLLDVFPEDQRQASQPIQFVSAQMPPTLLIHGSDDDVVDDGNSVRMAERITSVGGTVTLTLYDGVGHAAIAAGLSPPLDFANSTLEDSLTFLDALSGE